MLRFLVSVKRPYIQQSSPEQTEGLKVGCGMGGFKEWVCASHRAGLRNGWWVGRGVCRSEDKGGVKVLSSRG